MEVVSTSNLVSSEQKKVDKKVFLDKQQANEKGEKGVNFFRGLQFLHEK